MVDCIKMSVSGSTCVSVDNHEHGGGGGGGGRTTWARERGGCKQDTCTRESNRTGEGGARHVEPMREKVGAEDTFQVWGDEHGSHGSGAGKERLGR